MCGPFRVRRDVCRTELCGRILQWTIATPESHADKYAELCHPVVSCRGCCCCRGCCHCCHARRAHRSQGLSRYRGRCLHRCLGCRDVVTAMLFIYMVLSFLMLLPVVDEAAVIAAELYCWIYVIAAVVGAAAIIVGPSVLSFSSFPLPPTPTTPFVFGTWDNKHMILPLEAGSSQARSNNMSN